jgi:hypothetical protein
MVLSFFKEDVSKVEKDWNVGNHCLKATIWPLNGLLRSAHGSQKFHGSSPTQTYDQSRAD